MKHLCILFLVLSILSPGCAKFKKAPKNQPRLSVSGVLIAPDAFKEGQKIAVAGFKAGPGASAGEKTDRFAQKMIEGIREGISSSKASFVLTDNAEEADLVIDGYIEELSKRNFEADGEVWLAKSGRKLYSFHCAHKLNKKSNLPQIAYDAGRGIADFMMDQIEERSQL